jgi:interferon-induced GTP-binding protein Mx1
MQPPSPTSELTVGDIGAESALLTDVIDAQVGPIINLIDQLRAVGIEKDIQIPQIAVMGDQSSGKSSVLEALSGIPFPRGSGLVTKCATELRMKKSPGSVWQASISLSWDHMPQPSMAGKVDTPEDLGEKITSLTEVMLLARGRHATFEAEHSIVIELTAPNVPDLTVIDLPGIVRTQVNGQSSAVMAEVDHLLDRYLKQERTIILCVIPSNVDIATVDILERANKVRVHPWARVSRGRGL